MSFLMISNQLNAFVFLGAFYSHLNRCLQKKKKKKQILSIVWIKLIIITKTYNLPYWWIFLNSSKAKEWCLWNIRKIRTSTNIEQWNCLMWKFYFYCSFGSQLFVLSKIFLSVQQIIDFFILFKIWCRSKWIYLILWFWLLFILPFNSFQSTRKRIFSVRFVFKMKKKKSGKSFNWISYHFFFDQ